MLGARAFQTEKGVLDAKILRLMHGWNIWEIARGPMGGADGAMGVRAEIKGSWETIGVWLIFSW